MHFTAGDKKLSDSLMMPCLLRLAPLTIICATTLPLLAQQGDQPNEIQQPVPAEWKIPSAPILSAEEELRTFKVAPGFHVELAAAEPLLGDPIAASIGPDGRLWVVEMRGYMLDIDATGEKDPVASIAVLEDTDADGRFDRRTVFLDKLVMPRALSLVGDGVLVAEPPHLWFARDLDGDGVADSKIEIAANYGGTGNPEHMANGLVWMMDNWIYSANHTARFRFEGGTSFTSDSTITRGQWGITQDDAGHLYYNSNSDPLRVDVIPSAYFKRNPNLTNPQGTNVQVAPADLPTWPGRITPGVNRGYKTLRSDGTLPSVTAACSPVIYRGELFPAEFRGDAFICEPAGNLIKRIHLVNHDGVPQGTNAYEHSEFLTSTDERFRPVSAYNGPDGALWIVDLYRGVIQHRTYVTSYLRAQVKDRRLEEGRARGRIWRVVPDGTPQSAVRPNLAAASTAELVRALSAPSGWTRDTAQRLLVEHKNSAAVSLLQQAIRSGSSALGRLHALWTLDGIGALDRSSVYIAINDADPRVSAAAIRLSERWLANSADDSLYQRVVDRTHDAAMQNSAPVILQAALSLGEATSPKKLPAFVDLAVRHGRLPFLGDAIASGLAGDEVAFIRLASNQAGAENTASTIAAAVQSVLGSGNVEHLQSALAPLNNDQSPVWVRNAILDGIDAYLPRRADGARVSGKLPAEPKPLLALASHPGTAEGTRAIALLANLNWPGKPGGPATAAPLTPEETKRFDRGRAQFVALCANCHQPDGKGLAGLAPPLVNSRWALGWDQLAASIVLAGKEDEGKVMPSLRTVLDDEAIASVLTYVRRSWGHTAPAVTPATVANARAATASRTEPLHEPDLVELSQAQAASAVP